MTKIASETVKRLYNDKGQPRKDLPPSRAPPLPLVPETFSKDDKDLRKKGSYMLKVNPALETSADFKFTMYHVDGTESLRTTIQWYKDVWQVIKGLGLDGNPEGMIPFIQTTCHGSANAAFQDTLQGLREELRQRREEQEVGQLVRDPDEDDDLWNERLLEEEEAVRAAGLVFTKTHVDEAVRAVISNASPYKVLQKQRRYMRRYMRKPSDMKIRTFVHNLMKLNHDEELPYLPPFGGNQKLSDDDIIEIILNASPNSWTNEMDRQNFDPLDHTVRDLLSFCERIEQLEPTGTTNGSVAKKHDHNKRSKNSGEKGKPTGKWCTFHKTDSHDSSECCKVLLNKDKAKPSYGNKTWKRKSEEGKSYSKEELNAIVKKVVDEARKSWNQKTKDKGTKRKKEEANLMEDESNTTTTDNSCDSEVTQEDLDELDRQLEEVGLNDNENEMSEDEFSV
jgi:hypothetical protein